MYVMPGDPETYGLVCFVFRLLVTVACCVALFAKCYEVIKEERNPYDPGALFFALLFGGLGSSMFGCLIYAFYLNIINPTPELQIARAEQVYQEAQKAHAQELKEAKAKLKIAEINTKRLALSSNTKESLYHAQKIKEARVKVKELQESGVNSSKSEPVDEQTKLILSALWLGACFFLQRLFERLFHDKGYALLTVCAAGFLLAFFTANYFLLGGSITGGIMGSVGDRA
jgi:hypothetical protein